MLDKKLNKEVKALFNEYLSLPYDYEDDKICNKYWNDIDNIIKPKLRELHDKSNDFETLSKNSILIFLYMNRKIKTIPTHQFGLYIGNSLKQISKLSR